MQNCQQNLMGGVVAFPDYYGLRTSIAMAEESARIAQRCAEAKETGEVRLDGCGLRKFPDAVFFILKGAEIGSVTLAGNALKRLTPKLAQNFTALTCELMHVTCSVTLIADAVVCMALLSVCTLYYTHTCSPRLVVQPALLPSRLTLCPWPAHPT